MGTQQVSRVDCILKATPARPLPSVTSKSFILIRKQGRRFDFIYWLRSWGCTIKIAIYPMCIGDLSQESVDGVLLEVAKMKSTRKVAGLSQTPENIWSGNEVRLKYRYHKPRGGPSEGTRNDYYGTPPTLLCFVVYLVCYNREHSSRSKTTRDHISDTDYKYPRTTPTPGSPRAHGISLPHSLPCTSATR